MKYIKLRGGLCVSVDDVDFEWLNQHKWLAHRLPNHIYAYRVTVKNGKNISIRMHREIMKPPNGMIIDHIDGNTLNNCRSNLRITDRSVNARNKKPGGTSKFMGVSRHRKKWLSHIKINDKYVHLGVFDDEAAAAEAYNKAAIHAGIADFCRLNKF